MMLHEKNIFLTYYVYNNGANENIKNTSIGISTYQILSASLLNKSIFHMKPKPRELHFVQLNKYETDPNILQIFQSNTSVC